MLRLISVGRILRVGLGGEEVAVEVEGKGGRVGNVRGLLFVYMIWFDLFFISFSFER